MNKLLGLPAKIAAALVLAAVVAGGMYLAQGDTQVVKANPGTDMFLKLPGIEGEAEDDTHQNEIDVLSWSWGISRGGGAAAGRGAGSGKANMQDLTITKFVDKSTPLIMKALLAGERIPEAVLTLRGDTRGQHEYLVITMEDVVVTSYQVEGSTSDDRPTETVSLNFSKAHVVYTEQEEDGSAGDTTEMTYDVQKNTVE